MVRILLLLILPGLSIAQTLTLKHSNTIYDVAISESGQIAVAGKDSTVYVYSKTGSLLSSYKGLNHSVSVVRFGFDLTEVIASDYDGNTYLIDLTNDQIKKQKLHEKSILDLMILNDQKLLVSSSRDQSVAICSRDMTQKVILKGHNGQVRKAAYVPGQGIVTVADDQSIIVWSLEGQQTKRIDQAHTAAIWEIIYVGKNDMILTGDKSGNIIIWNNRFEKINSWMAHEGPVSGMASDGKYIFTSGMDGFIKIWDDKGEMIKAFKAHDKYCSSLTLSADGLTLVSSGGDGLVNIWSVIENIK